MAFVKKQFKTAAFANEADPNGNRYGNKNFKDIIDFKKLGIEKWKPSEGMNEIDVIPYNAGKQNPLVATGKMDEGDVLYMLDIYVHKGIGASGSNYVCLEQYGKECPICKESRRLYGLGTEDAKKQATKISAKRRIYYHVHDLKNNKFGYWDTGYKLVSEPIRDLQKVQLADDGGTINPYDYEDGRTITFLGKKDVFEKREFISPSTFGFKKRPAPLSDDVLNRAVDFSNGLTIYDYETLEKVLSGDEDAVSSVGTETQASSAESLADQAYEVAEPKAADSKNFDNMKEVDKPKKDTEAKAEEHVCPYGFNWGEADQHNECSPCKFWEQCYPDK